MDQGYALEQELELLEPKGLRIYRDEFEDLTLELEDGRVIRQIAVQRAFPVTNQDRFIVLRDAEGEEVGIIADISKLDRESHRALEHELERSYFTPTITQVNSIEEQFHIPKWDVETDRGPRVFDIGSNRRDVRVLGRGRIFIKDAEGNIYEIPDYRKLDTISRAMVEARI
jgi:hypothetical protein